jgi:hypothetical protein
MDVVGYTKTFGMDQGTVLGNDQKFQAMYGAPLTDPKRNGICTGLSMIWLARLMTFHDDNAKKREAALNEAAYVWGGKTQDHHLALGDPGGSMENFFNHAYAEPLRAYSLVILPGSTVEVPTANLGAAANAFAPYIKDKGTYRLWNVGLRTSTGSAGHMVASYASGGKMGFFRHLYFFDPNMGEYKVDTGDTAKFVKAWLESYASTFLGVLWLASFEVDYG